MSLPALLLVATASTSTAADWQRAGARWETLAEETMAHLRAERARRAAAEAGTAEALAVARVARADAEVYVAELRTDLARAQAERDSRVPASSRAWASAGGGLLGLGLGATGASVVACDRADCRSTGAAVGAATAALGTLVLWFALDPPWR